MAHYHVTPRVGVWIETQDVVKGLDADWSLPAWECGLKRVVARTRPDVGVSLPAWECGLKPLSRQVSGLPPCHSPRGSVD